MLGRARNKNGKLVRRDPSLPPWVHVDDEGMRIVKNPQPLSRIFKDVARWKGLSDEQTAAEWRDWRRANPKFDRGGR